MKVFVKTALILIIVSLVRGLSLAAEPAETLRFTILDQRPFIWKHDNGFKGFHYEVAAKLAQKTGHKLEVSPAPILRAAKLLEKGEVDYVIMRDSPTLQSLGTRKIFLIDVDLSIYFKKGREAHFKDGIRGRISRLSNACAELADKKNIEWFEAGSYNQAYKLLSADRVDAACGSIAFEYSVKSNGGDMKEFKSIRISRNPVWIHALPGTGRTKWQALEKAAKELIADGTIERLAREYEDTNR